MADYIPAQDPDFDAWIGNFVSYATANAASLGLVAADLTDITTFLATWGVDFPAHQAAQTAARTATQNKDAARVALEAEARDLALRIQASPKVTDAERAALGITVPDRTRTPAPPPDTRPTAMVDTAQRLQHTLRLSDEATPTRTGKPDGVRGAEVWVKVGGAPPTDPGELRFVGVFTRSKAITAFSGDEGGETAHSMARWVNTRGEKGPWSETVSATIAA